MGVVVWLWPKLFVFLIPPPDKIALKPWQRNLLVLNWLIQALWNDQPWKTELQTDVGSAWVGVVSHGCWHQFSHGLQPLMLSWVVSESPVGTLCLAGQAETEVFTEDEAAALAIWKLATSFLWDVVFFPSLMSWPWDKWLNLLMQQSCCCCVLGLVCHVDMPAVRKSSCFWVCIVFSK